MARYAKKYVAESICIDCQNSFLPKWEGLKTCTDCYYASKEYSRSCIKCKDGLILPEQPDEVLLCKKCNGFETKANMRTCTKCKKPAIHPNAPSFVKLCNVCERGGGTYVGQCTVKGCDGTTDADWKSTCVSCWRAGKR